MFYIIKQEELYQTTSTPASFPPVTVKWAILHYPLKEKWKEQTKSPQYGPLQDCFVRSILCHFCLNVRLFSMNFRFIACCFFTYLNTD